MFRRLCNVSQLFADFAGANELCWCAPVAAGIRFAQVAVHGDRVAIGIPEIGRAFVVSAGLSHALELRPPSGDFFADGAGFGASVAIDNTMVAVGSVRIGGHGNGVEQPQGNFHAGAIYTFDVSSGALLWQLSADSGRAFGHSLSIQENMVAYGIYEAPGPDGGSVRLRSAARGAVAFRSRNGEALHVIDGPAGTRGFGAELSGGVPLVTTSVDKDSRVVWAIQNNNASRLMRMPAILNGIPANELANAGPVIAVSAAGGFSSDAGRTVVTMPGYPPYELAAGGPLAISKDRLSVLVRSAPEGLRHNKLILYDISKNGVPARLFAIDYVVAAALSGTTVFVVLAQPGGAVKLCRMEI